MQKTDKKKDEEIEIGEERRIAKQCKMYRPIDLDSETKKQACEGRSQLPAHLLRKQTATVKGF